MRLFLPCVFCNRKRCTYPSLVCDECHEAARQERSAKAREYYQKPEVKERIREYYAKRYAARKNEGGKIRVCYDG